MSLMVNNYHRHLISKGEPIRRALELLNELALDAILFVVDENHRLVGSLTDGDVRRGLLRNLTMENKVEDFIQPNPKFLQKGDYNLEQVLTYRDRNFRILPVLNRSGRVCNVVNFRMLKSYLPLDAVIMAGGKGERLRPLTNDTPKPLLKVGSKPIIEHNIDRLMQFGVDDFWISLNYLGRQIEEYFGDGTSKYIKINYIWEDKPLGTIGAVRMIDSFEHDYVLVTNSDLLTNLDYEDFFLDFLRKDADMAVATIPYSVDIPYAVLETSNNHILSFKEKPTFTYYSNGGIYLVKREVLDRIPRDKLHDSTDLMEELIRENKKVISYPMRNYWLDIGKPEDFEKAQEDIKHLDLK